MDLAGQYELQNKWRNWEGFVNKLPLKSKDIILDLGCGLGFTTRLISRKVNYVFGLDNNPELINYAKHHNSAGNIQYIKQDIRSLDTAKLPLSDGIWLSYVTAYFPDLSAGELNNFLNSIDFSTYSSSVSRPNFSSRFSSSSDSLNW